jgi:hypothetical protein
MRMKTLRRVLAYSLGTLALAAALITAWHLPPVRRLLGLAPLAHPTHGSCPFGFGGSSSTPSASDIAAARQREVDAAAAYRVAHADEPLAHARPALGFVLGTTTIAQVDQWASDNHVSCTHRNGDALVECANIPSALLAPAPIGATAAWFEFGARGTLRTVKTERDDADVAKVADAFTQTQDAVTAAAGAPRTIVGSAAPGVLSHGLLRQASVEYRFQDYRAVVRATNMGHGYSLTETYATYTD